MLVCNATVGLVRMQVMFSILSNTLGYEFYFPLQLKPCVSSSLLHCCATSKARSRPWSRASATKEWPIDTSEHTGQTAHLACQLMRTYWRTTQPESGKKDTKQTLCVPSHTDGQAE